jgi:apolipoprotein N-acyltransferase
MNFFRTYAFSALGGILYALGYPSLIAESLLITPIIGIALLFHYVLIAKSLKQRITHLIAFNLGFNYTGFYWIAATLQEFGELPWPLAIFLGGLFTFIITPHLWAGVFFIHLVITKNIITLKHIQRPGLYSTILAIFLTCMEYFTPQQFDVMLGQPWIALAPYLGYASIGGLPIYSYFSYLIVFELLSLIHTKRTSYFNLISTMMFIISNPFLIQDTVGEKPTELNVRVVQANISNFLKIDAEKGSYPSVAEVIERYKTLSLADHNFSKKIDLIIWPETAYPYAIESKRPDIKQTELPPIVTQIAQLMSAELLIGGYDVAKKDSKDFYQTEYNTTFHINTQGLLENTYHKQILIPFGETLPFGPLNPYLSQHIKNISFFSVGEKFSVFKLENGMRLINSICYELLKPEFVRKYLNAIPERPHFMVNLTNDSWYGKTAEPYQHLFLAKWRAVEFNLPIIRATNTGISSIIFANGTESERANIFETRNLDLTAHFGVNKPTIYQLYGIATIFPLWLLYLIFHLLLIKLKRDE